MARTDRLMRLMDVMRRLPAPVTAARLASETGISQRQLYRDIATLRAGGALIDGEAGLGYRLVEDSALPPQSFSRLEIEALRLAVESLPRIGDAELSEAAQGALSRIVATLPERQAQQIQHAIMRVWVEPAERDAPRVDMALLRHACWDEAALRISYLDLEGRESNREIWPLTLSYTERTLLLLAHCRLRMDFRLFHAHRIGSAEPTGAHFRPQRAALIREFIAKRGAPPDTKKAGR
ncbi:MAG: YafY family protein [Paracoccus sp. (in: a-proteobacteria)]|nr:YafY family protein [Paracoccus sp. (in: a-proteobacteria)]